MQGVGIDQKNITIFRMVAGYADPEALENGTANQNIAQERETAIVQCCRHSVISSIGTSVQVVFHYHCSRISLTGRQTAS
jgi:hypothetical protein